MRPLLRWLCRFAALAMGMACMEAQAVAFGVNIHAGETAEVNAQRAAVMAARQLTAARMDLVFDKPQDRFRDQVRRIRDQGGRVEAVVMTSHLWDHSCNRDLAAVERKAFDETAGTVAQVMDLVHDFELLNETDLQPEILREVPNNSAGWSTAPYEGKPCAAAMAAALRGMARAIRDLRARSGLPLRVLFGQSARNWGYLRFMQAQGVEWDVMTWHVYPGLRDPSLVRDPRGADASPLAQLARFGKPLHINEFNCGEIHRRGYENLPGQPMTEACLRAFAAHLRELVQQTTVALESIHVYELLDEPFKAAPENHFGLMLDLGRPKPHLLLYTAFAGGELSAAERCEITSRGLMTDGEIDGLRRGRGPAPPAGPCKPAGRD